jgi:hypothetical protein
MTFDPFQSFGDSVGDPARRAYAVTPNDAAELTPLPKALLIGGSGTIVLRAVDSQADVTIPVGAGQIVPIRASFVRATGTTATQIVALA